jgi:broad specificity phosphatase PhoE
MKKVYFVRHGQVQSNITKQIQQPDERLTEVGEKQAEYVGKRFKSLGIETIITSSHERALQTAQAIEMELSAGIVISDLFIEVKQPSEYFGRNYQDPEILENFRLRQEFVNDALWRYSDEENFHDFVERAHKAISFIEEREEGVICVVTHGEFLRAMMGVLMMGDDLDFTMFLHLRNFIRTSNTGITYCTYNPDAHTQRKWNLITWNDHVHLGEISEAEYN